MAEEVLREYPAISKYRIRAVKRKDRVELDIREYISSETFEGFTRRGVRLRSKQELVQLQSHLKEILDSDLLAS